MARVPYSPEIQVAPTEGGAGQPISVPAANPNAFGAGIGEATEHLGATIGHAGEQAFDVAKRYQEMANQTAVNSALNAFGDTLGNSEMDLHSRKGSDAVAAFGDFKNTLTTKMNEVAKNIQSPMAQQQFLTSAQRNLEYTMRSAGAYVGSQAEDAHVNSISGRIQNENNLATLHFQDPEAVRHSIDNTVTHSLDLAHVKGLDQDSANALVSHNVGNLVHSVIMANATQGTSPQEQSVWLKRAQGIFDEFSKANVPGAPDGVPMIDAAHRDQIAQVLQSRTYTNEIRQNTEATRALLNQERAERAQSEKVMKDWVPKILTGNVTADQIAGDHSLRPQDQENLYHLLLEHDRSDANADVKTYGDGFYKLYQQIHLPDGDPNRITDPSALASHVGENGDLTVHGVDRLTQEILGKKTPDGEAESAMKSQFLKNAKSQISGANDAYGIKDSKGEEQFLKFMGNFFPAFVQGKAQGKTAAQLLTPGSPDYLGKNLDTFIRPTSQRLADMMHDSGAGLTSGKAVSAADLDNLPQADFVKAVQANPGLRGEAEAIALKKGWIRATPAAVRVPVEGQ